VSCPICQELLRQAREEAERGPRSLSSGELSQRGIGRSYTVLVLELLVVLGVLWASFTVTSWAIAAPCVPKVPVAVVIDCDEEQDLCSTLLSAGVVAAGDADEE
jgi:hypothetical protein